MSPVAPAVTVLGLNYSPEPTGIAPYTTAMARGLAGRGIRVRVGTTHPHYPEWSVAPGYGEWSRRELLDGVQVHRLKHYVPSPPTGIRRLLSEISFGVRALFIKWGRPDAIVVVSPALFASAIVAARAKVFHRRAPLVVWVQDLYTLGLSETGQGSGATGRIIQAVEGWLLRRADRVVVIHDRFARRVCADFGLNAERVAVIRNWTHLAPAKEIDRARARAEFGWETETVVLHAGNMGVKQGLDNVIDAARLAEERGNAVRFVLLGSGGERERLVALASDVSTVDFIAPLPDEQFANALAAADILLVNEKPGVAEMAVPSKLTSYFSTGRPVLAATDSAGITAEEIRSADAGITVPSGDPEALLSAAIELGSDSTTADRFGVNGKHYRETVLDETHAIDRFATLLSTLVAEGSTRRVASSPSA